MRIWDLDPSCLCRQHLLGEHRELHAIWSVLTRGRSGYSRHPETLRWKGKLRALYGVHKEIVNEMARRGYAHRSPLEKGLLSGKRTQDEFVDSVEEQIRILRAKGCGCAAASSRRGARQGKSAGREQC